MERLSRNQKVSLKGALDGTGRHTFLPPGFPSYSV